MNADITMPLLPTCMISKLELKFWNLKPLEGFKTDIDWSGIAGDSYISVNQSGSWSESSSQLQWHLDS